MPPVSLTVDLVPIFLLLALGLCASAIAVSVINRKAPAHGLFWALGGGVGSVGLLLIVQRDVVPNVLSILIGNQVLLIGEALIAVGASRYIGRRTTLDGAVGLGATAIFGVAYLNGADILIRVAIYTFPCAFFAIRCASAFFAAKRSMANVSAGALASLVCIVEITRGALVFADVISLDDKAMANGFSVFIGVPVSICIAIGVVAYYRGQFAALFGIKPPEPLPVIDALVAPTAIGAWILPSCRSALIAPGGSEVRLTGNEYLVLQRLSEEGDAVDRLSLNALIGRSTLDPKDRGIDILFSRLRRKCADAGVELPINALRGRGYVFLGELQRH